VIHNGVPAGQYSFRESVAEDAPLLFLGRLERIKGAHTAIEVARQTGRELVVAGNVVDTAEGQRYYKQELVPHIDGSQIRYVGPVDDAQKNELLGACSALLMPLEWDEPFGIVMAEALACGTPVIAFRRGAVPEIVEHEVNGIICRDEGEMVDAVRRVGELDRGACRRSFEMRFSDRVIVSQYENLYRSRVKEATG
jgi:glycosyltransferase involved in cell wall biosynthesis